MADRHLREAHLARELGHQLLVRRIAIGVHEHDGDRADAVLLRALEFGAHGGQIGRLLDGAVGAHALVHFDDALIEHFGLDDVARENLRPRLVADPAARRGNPWL